MKKEVNPRLAGGIIVGLVVLVAALLLLSGRQQQAVIPAGLHIHGKSMPPMPPPPPGTVYQHGPVTQAADREARAGSAASRPSPVSDLPSSLNEPP